MRRGVSTCRQNRARKKGEMRYAFEELVENHSSKKGCCTERKVRTLHHQRRRHILSSDPDMICERVDRGAQL